MSDYCDCLGADDCDTPGFYRETVIKKGRKNHKCTACSGVIKKGDGSVVVAGSWDGVVSGYRYHQNCFDLLAEAGKFYNTVPFLDCRLNGCVEGWYNDARKASKDGEKLCRFIELFTMEGGNS